MVGRLASRQVGPLAVAGRADAVGLAQGCGQPGVVEDGRGPPLGGIADTAGARWAELGSAPGGASQALLQRGYHVLGIDPAAMDPPSSAIRILRIFAAARWQCAAATFARFVGSRPI